MRVGRSLFGFIGADTEVVARIDLLLFGFRNDVRDFLGHFGI